MTSYKITFRLMCSLFILFSILGCGLSSTPTIVIKEVTAVPKEESSSPPIQMENTPIPVPDQKPASTPVPIVNVESIALVYNLPSTTLSEATGLYASPNRIETVIPVQLPVGTTIYVMGRNATGSHLRVVWNTGVGWIPASFTDYNAAREKINSLPVFTREPPACAVPLVSQFSLNSEWINETGDKKRIAVVIDLFRSQYGDFPSSSLALAVNGQEVTSSRREIVERGQFSLKDVVFSLPGYVYPGDRITYQLHTSSNEPLAFLATVFSIPENCVWKTD